MLSDAILCGDALSTLRQVPSGIAHCCVTSPPYWNLRDYGVPGQIGLEATIEEYVARMVAIFAEVRRVLRPDGTLWLNLGDAYANDVKWGGSTSGKHAQGLHGGTSIGRGKRRLGLKPKDLIGLPWRVAFALQEDGWWLRSDIVWHKSNPMPESVTDRPTRAHEYIFLLTRSERYYYDAEAIREPAKPGSKITKMPDGWDTGPGAHGAFHRLGREKGARVADKQRGHSRRHAGFNDRWDAMSKEQQQSLGANKRDVWSLGTYAFPGAHFATFPPKLIEPCILAGCPPGGLVLDPFMGAGTTAVVAVRHNRHFLGIELNPVYIELAEERLGAGIQRVLWTA